MRLLNFAYFGSIPKNDLPRPLEWRILLPPFSHLTLHNIYIYVWFLLSPPSSQLVFT